MAESSLRGVLADIGLAQYGDVFIKEGFDTWATVCEITEPDLDYMDVRLGHRRKLQRAIADSNGSPTQPTGQTSTLRHLTDHTPQVVTNQAASAGTDSPTSDARNVTIKAKRKYKRHPKPDANAPKRPPSAYVIFASDVRERLKDERLDFTNMAKVVGARWQALSIEDREKFEREANSEKERFNADMSEYRKTDEHEQYQRYLQDFKRRHEGRDAKSRRTDIIASTDGDHDDQESHRKSRSASGESRSTNQLTQQFRTGTLDSQSPSSRLVPAFAPSPYTSDAWTAQSAHPHDLGPRSNQRSGGYQQQQRQQIYRPDSVPSSFPRHLPGMSPMHPQGRSQGHSPLSVSPLDDPLQRIERPNLTSNPPRPHASSTYASQDPAMRNRSTKAPHLPVLLNPTKDSPHTNRREPPIPNHDYDQEYGRPDRRAQWRNDVLPGLYSSTSGLSSQSHQSNSERRQQSPPQSPFTGRMIDGQLTPPARPAKVAASPTQQFPEDRTLKSKAWGTYPASTDALLDPDESMRPYHPRPLISELRSQRSPRDL